MENFFKNLSISNKLAVVFLFLLFMMGIGGVVGLYNARQIAKVTESLYLNSFKRAETLSVVENEFLSARQEFFLHTVISDKASRSYLEVTIDEHKKKIERILLEYKATGIAAPEDEEAYQNLIDGIAIYWQIHETVAELSNKGLRDKAIGIIRMEGNTAFTDSIGALRHLIKKERDTAYAAYKKSDFFAKIIISVTFAFTLLAIIVAGLLWMALIRSIVRPIITLEESAKKIGQGFLAHRVPVQTTDEIGNLAIEFNKMAEGLQDSYATLEKKVGERTEQLRLTNEELFKKKHELEYANIGLQEANKMKSQFLANVSHELRTPLNSIIGFSELLEERAFGELNERQTQYIDFIHSSGEHLLQLINDILDLSKIEAGRVELMHEVFPVTEAIGETLGIIRPIAHKRHITINTKPVVASPKLRADKAKFKQIILNLLSNAVKFNVDGGSVTIDWDITEEASSMEMNRYIVFKVKDTGIGIKDEDRGKLFKEFEQIDSSITREYGGTGLGLVLTKRLTELHGGAIWFESVPGKGTTFFVRLPQGTNEIDTPSATDGSGRARRFADDDSQRKRHRVIIAAESQDINRLLEIYLAGSEFDVLTAPDGATVLQKAQNESPFAIVMGITLSKKDGWAVLHELKDSPAMAAIPVIIISSTDNKEHALSLGVSDYLEQPVGRERLINSLAKLLK